MPPKIVILEAGAAADGIEYALNRKCFFCGLPASLHFCHCSREGLTGPLSDHAVNRPIYTHTNDPDLMADVARGARP